MGQVGPADLVALVKVNTPLLNSRCTQEWVHHKGALKVADATLTASRNRITEVEAATLPAVLLAAFRPSQLRPSTR